MKTNGPELISFYMSVLKRSLITEFFRIFFLLRKSTTQNFFFKLVLEISNFPFVFFKKGKKEEKLGIQSPFFLFSQSFYSKCRFFFAFDSARCHFLSCIIQLSDYTIWNWKVLFKRTFTTFVPYSKKKFKKLIFYNCVQLLGRVDQENFSISSNF